MKTVRIMFLILFSMILFAGCRYTPSSYSFAFGEEDIVAISIVHMKGYVDVEHDETEYDIVYTVKNIEQFLNEFSKIEFRRIWFGDPTQVESDELAIRVSYKNGLAEYISFTGQEWWESEGKEGWRFGKHYCDETEFKQFLEKYIASQQ